MCGVDLSGYSRFSRNDSSIIDGPDAHHSTINGPGIGKGDESVTYIDRCEREGLKKTNSSSSYGAVIITDNGSEYPAAGAYCTVQQTPEEDVTKSKVRQREELLDTASLTHQT